MCMVRFFIFKTLLKNINTLQDFFIFHRYFFFYLLFLFFCNIISTWLNQLLNTKMFSSLHIITQQHPTVSITNFQLSIQVFLHNFFNVISTIESMVCKLSNHMIVLIWLPILLFFFFDIMSYISIRFLLNSSKSITSTWFLLETHTHTITIRIYYHFGELCYWLALPRHIIYYSTLFICIALCQSNCVSFYSGFNNLSYLGYLLRTLGFRPFFFFLTCLILYCYLFAFTPCFFIFWFTLYTIYTCLIFRLSLCRGIR